MTGAPPKYIYFDLGNVLMLFSHAQQCEQAAAVAGCSVDRAREVLFDDQLEDDYERGTLDDEGFYREFCQRTGTKPTPDDLERAVCDIFTPNLAMIPLISQLSGVGHRLGILSNTNAAHWRWVHGRYSMVRQFPQAVLSFQEGSMKPDEPIYQAAIKRAGVPAESIFFTDDRAENVAAARQLGIDAVQFESAAQVADELHARHVGFNY